MQIMMIEMTTDLTTFNSRNPYFMLMLKTDEIVLVFLLFGAVIWRKLD
jgi:hypothetical protein